MHCEKCGKIIDKDSKFCNNCGQEITHFGTNPISESSYSYDINTSSDNPIDFGNNSKKGNNKLNYEDEPISKTEDKASIGLIILSFIIPLVGLILFISLKRKTPKKAKAIGISALIGLIVGAIFYIIMFAFGWYLVVSALSAFFDGYDEYYDDYYDYDYNYEYEYEYDEELENMKNDFEKYFEMNEI